MARGCSTSGSRAFCRFFDGYNETNSLSVRWSERKHTMLPSSLHEMQKYNTLWQSYRTKMRLVRFFNALHIQYLFQYIFSSSSSSSFTSFVYLRSLFFFIFLFIVASFSWNCLGESLKIDRFARKHQSVEHHGVSFRHRRKLFIFHMHIELKKSK